MLRSATAETADDSHAGIKLGKRPCRIMSMCMGCWSRGEQLPRKLAAAKGRGHLCVPSLASLILHQGRQDVHDCAAGLQGVRNVAIACMHSHMKMQQPPISRNKHEGAASPSIIECRRSGNKTCKDCMIYYEVR